MEAGGSLEIDANLVYIANSGQVGLHRDLISKKKKSYQNCVLSRALCQINSSKHIKLKPVFWVFFRNLRSPVYLKYIFFLEILTM